MVFLSPRASTLLLFSILAAANIQLSNAQTRKQVLRIYSKINGVGLPRTYECGESEAGTGDFNGKARSVCGVGTWILYKTAKGAVDPIDLDTAGEVVILNNTCRNLKISPGQITSIRYIGSCEDYSKPALQIFTTPYFGGDCQTFHGDKEYETVKKHRMLPSSLVITGRQNWTIFMEPGFKGEAYCLTPKPDLDNAIGSVAVPSFGFPHKEYQFPVKSIKSARLGCRPEDKSTVVPVGGSSGIEGPVEIGRPTFPGNVVGGGDSKGTSEAPGSTGDGGFSSTRLPVSKTTTVKLPSSTTTTTRGSTSTNNTAKPKNVPSEPPPLIRTTFKSTTQIPKTTAETVTAPKPQTTPPTVPGGSSSSTGRTTVKTSRPLPVTNPGLGTISKGPLPSTKPGPKPTEVPKSSKETTGNPHLYTFKPPSTIVPSTKSPPKPTGLPSPLISSSRLPLGSSSFTITTSTTRPLPTKIVPPTASPSTTTSTAGTSKKPPPRTTGGPDGGSTSATSTVRPGGLTKAPNGGPVPTSASTSTTATTTGTSTKPPSTFTTGGPGGVSSSATSTIRPGGLTKVPTGGPVPTSASTLTTTTSRPDPTTSILPTTTLKKPLPTAAVPTGPATVTVGAGAPGTGGSAGLSTGGNTAKGTSSTTTAAAEMESFIVTVTPGPEF